MAKKLSAEVEKRVIELYQQGIGGTTIPQMTGVGRDTVYAILDRNGILERHNLNKLTVEQHKLVCDDYQLGYSLKELGKKYNCNYVTIRNVLIRNNVKLRRQGSVSLKFTDKQVLHAKQMLADKVPFAQIADALFVSRHHVQKHLKCHGLTWEPRQYEGKEHVAWRGGRTNAGYGYILVKIGRDSLYFPMTDKKGYVLEHRLNLAKKLGRCLLSSEESHHIDGNRSNNDPSNLQLRLMGHGAGHAYECAECGSRNIEPTPI